MSATIDQLVEAWAGQLDLGSRDLQGHIRDFAPQLSRALHNHHFPNADDEHGTLRHQLSHAIHLLEKLMSAVSDFIKQQQAFNLTVGADIDTIVAATGGLTEDVTALNASIVALQEQLANSGISAEDTAAMAQLVEDGAALQAKADAAAAAASALDAQTPPVAPPSTEV